MVNQTKDLLLVHWLWETLVLGFADLVLFFHQLELLEEFIILVKHLIELLSFGKVLLGLVVKIFNKSLESLLESFDLIRCEV